MQMIDRFYKASISVSALLLALFIFNSCAALNKAQLQRQERTRQKQQQRYMTLERPESEVIASDDGLVIESQHYTMTFSKDLLNHKDFDEIKERQDIGTGGLVFMESLYQYVHDIFGFEPMHRIAVTLHETYRGTNRIATTTMHSRTVNQNGEYLKIIQGISMDFPVVMFNQRPVRAHELTHAFTNIYLLPTWFAEGIAVLVEVEYAKGSDHKKVDLNDDLKTDLDGVNAVQTWEGHLTIDALTQWRYNYSYAIVSELHKRFGKDFYPTLFRLIEEDRLHQKLPGEMSTSFLVYYMSQAAGQDLISFFEELKFNVRRLTRNEILVAIKQLNETRRNSR